MYILSIFVGLDLKRDGDKINNNKDIARTRLGTAASVPTMCFVHIARTVGARIARSVMFTRSISRRNGRMNILFLKKSIIESLSELTERKQRYFPLLNENE